MAKLPFELKLTKARIAASIFLCVGLPLFTYTQLRRRVSNGAYNQQGNSMYNDDGVRKLRDGTEVQRADIWDVEKWKKNVKVKELK